MNSSKNTLEEIYFSLYDRIQTVLPEFGFKKINEGYQSTTDVKITEEKGKIGKVYLYRNNKSNLIDYTRSSISIWDYIKQRDKLTQQETFFKLVELSEIVLPMKEYSSEKIERAKLEIEIWENANNFFVNSLETCDEAEKYRNYINERGYGEVKMELGFIPSQNELRKYLKAKGYSDEDIKTFIKLPVSIGTSHLLTIPFRNSVGNIRGIAARNINYTDTDKVGKYLYSSGLEKSKLLFNLNKVRREKDLIIVEGLLDALYSSALGLENIISLGGTSFNDHQLQLIKRSGVKSITLCLDNDKAGKSATLRIINTTLKDSGLKVYVADLPDGIKDPDEYIKKKGLENFEKIISDSRRDFEFILEFIRKKYQLIEDEKGELNSRDIDNFLDEVVEEASKIKNPFDRDIFLGKFLKIVEPYNISKTNIERTTDKLKDKVEKELIENEFKKLINEVNNLHRNCKTIEALELIQSRIPKIKFNDRESEYNSLLVPLKERELIQSLRKQPESLISGYYIEQNEELLLPSGSISIFSAPVSHGKTTFLINLALNIVNRYKDKKVCLFSYEESCDNVLLYALNTYLNMDLSKNNRRSLVQYYRNGDFTYFNQDGRKKSEEFIAKKEKFFKEIIEKGKLIIRYLDFNSDSLIEAIYYLNKVTDIGAVFIDYMQLLKKGGSTRYNSRQEELKQICLDLKDLAVDTGLPIILSAQFNREVVNLLQLHPTKIGEAGDIERVANLIVGFWNNNFTFIASEADKKEIETKECTKNTLFVKILKNRGGIVGSENILNFDGNKGLIQGTNTY